jgi:hypothetical protein
MNPRYDLILRKFFCMVRPMKIHRQKVSFGAQTLWYDVISFKSAGALVQSTTGSRGVCISGSNGSNAGYMMFRGGVKGTGYPLHSPVSPSLPLPCVTVCHRVSTGLYHYRQHSRHTRRWEINSVIFQEFSKDLL